MNCFKSPVRAVTMPYRRKQVTQHMSVSLRFLIGLFGGVLAIAET